MGEHNNKRKMKELEQQQHQQEIESTRVGGFGGSDAAMFLRIAKRGGVDGLSNTDLYRIAVAMGIKPYAPVPVTEAMQAGHTFEDSYERMLKDRGDKNFEREVNDVLNYLPAECLARTIIEQNIEKNMKSAHILINLSDKQRWVVAFELLKNEEYCKRFDK